MIHYVDYTGRLTPAQLKAAGIAGVCRYLSWLPNPKVCLKPEYDMLTAGGIDVVLNWEYDARDWLGGPLLGKSHAAEAVAQATAIGYPMGKPLPGSCDFNMSRAEWLSSGKWYAIEFAKVVKAAGYLPGVYGPYNVLQWCHDETPMEFFWQAGMSWAWDNNNQVWPGANAFQRDHFTIAGLDTDINDILKGWDMSVTPEEIAQIARAVWENPIGYADSSKGVDKRRPAHFALTDAADMANAGQSQYDGRVGYVPALLNQILQKGATLSDAQLAELKKALPTAQDIVNEMLSRIPKA